MLCCAELELRGEASELLTLLGLWHSFSADTSTVFQVVSLPKDGGACDKYDASQNCLEFDSGP